MIPKTFTKSNTLDLLLLEGCHKDSNRLWLYLVTVIPVPPLRHLPPAEIQGEFLFVFLRHFGYSYELFIFDCGFCLINFTTVDTDFGSRSNIVNFRTFIS